MSLRGDSRGAGEATADEPERRQGRRNWVRFIPARERGGRLWYPFGAWSCSALPLTRARPRMSEAAGQPHVRFRRSIILMFPRLDNKSLSAGGWLMYSPSGHHECRRTHAWDGLRPWGDAAWVLVGRCARAESCISCELGSWLMKVSCTFTSAAVPIHGAACELGATQHGPCLDAARGSKAASAASLSTHQLRVGWLGQSLSVSRVPAAIRDGCGYVRAAWVSQGRCTLTGCLAGLWEQAVPCASTDRLCGRGARLLSGQRPETQIGRGARLLSGQKA